MVTPSVYRPVQCAGDSNYQQMTVAVPNVDQMVIQGSRKYSHRGEGGQEKRIEKAKIKVEECKSKGTLGNMLPVCRDNTTKQKPDLKAKEPTGDFWISVTY